MKTEWRLKRIYNLNLIAKFNFLFLNKTWEAWLYVCSLEIKKIASLRFNDENRDVNADLRDGFVSIAEKRSLRFETNDCDVKMVRA